MAKSISQRVSALTLLMVAWSFPAKSMPETTFHDNIQYNSPPNICPYPCLPPPTSTLNCPPPPYLAPPPPYSLPPPFGPGLYPPPSGYYPPPAGDLPYPPPSFVNRYAPPPPNPILPYFPWYYKNPPPPPEYSQAARLGQSWIIILPLVLLVLFTFCI